MAGLPRMTGAWALKAVVLAAACAAAHAAVAAPAAKGTPAAAGGLNVTNVATGLEGAMAYPQMSILTSVIKSDPYMRQYLSRPGVPLTAFPSVNNATKAFLSSISRYAGVALANENFTRAVFDYMIVPGRVWSTAELVAAAPIQLKTLGGEMLNITADPKAPYGVRVNGFAVDLGNQATRDSKAVLHLIEGAVLPQSIDKQVAAWRVQTASAEAVDAAPASGAAPGAADAAAPAASGAPAASSGAPAASGSGAARVLGSAAVGAAVAVLAALL